MDGSFEDFNFDEEAYEREQIFHNAVREYIISALLFIFLYVSSYATICAFRRKIDREEVYGDDEDAMVYRISLWLCTFTLATSVAAVLLLPISIISNEILLLYPKSYYMQWLNSSLIHSLWNNVFLFANLAVFILMPFAYFFIESEGFTGSRKGIMARVYETFTVLFLLGVVTLGIMWVATAILHNDKSSWETLFNIWDFYLPLLYSCISLLGVLALLICTPAGFARLFTVMGQLVIKPQFLRDIDEELQTTKFEEDDLKRKLEQCKNKKFHLVNGHNGQNGNAQKHEYITDLQNRLETTERDRRELEKRRQVSSLRRNLGYPLVMLLLLALTALSVLWVTYNILALVTGEKSLTGFGKEAVLGIASFSSLGRIGAVLEITLILYLMLASVVGFYSLPFCKNLRPKKDDTSMTQIIGNCIVLLVLSSALPVLSWTLGITNFDLLGEYGKLEWLGSFYTILSYNLIFATATAYCLVKKFTATLRHEIIARFKAAFDSAKSRSYSVTSNGSPTYNKED